LQQEDSYRFVVYANLPVQRAGEFFLLLIKHVKGQKTNVTSPMKGRNNGMERMAVLGLGFGTSLTAARQAGSFNPEEQRSSQLLPGPFGLVTGKNVVLPD
jgi:hypothetical protein